MINRRAILRRELRKIVLVRHHIPMPSHQIKRAMILLYGRKLSIRLIHNPPIHMELVIDRSNGVQEVAGICQPVATQWTQIGELPHGTPHFGDVATRDFRAGSEVQAEADAPLDDADFSGLEVEFAHFGDDVETAELGADEEVAVGVAECSALHAGVDHVDVERDAFSDVGIAASG